MHYTGAPWLTRESRDREEDCETLLRRHRRCSRGRSVCDMGCGNGFYTLQLARLVGKRARLSPSTSSAKCSACCETAPRDERVENIEPVLGTVIDPRLEPNSCDLVLMVDVYHEFSHPEQMLAAIRQSLKPTGRVALVEFRAEDPNVPIKPLHKMSKEQILKEFEPNGFRLVEEFDKLPWQHLMFFERDDMQ